MAHKTLINGTAYEISGGKTLVNGTAYGIKNGKTLVGGTAYGVEFGPPGTKLIVNSTPKPASNGTYITSCDTPEIVIHTIIQSYCAFGEISTKSGFFGEEFVGDAKRIDTEELASRIILSDYSFDYLIISLIDQKTGENFNVSKGARIKLQKGHTYELSVANK